MNKKVFRKAASLVLALALVISMVPAMGIASATAGETTTFVISPRMLNSEFSGTTSGTMPNTFTTDDLYSYCEVGGSEHLSAYHRDWKLFMKNWPSVNGGDSGVTGANGLYFWYGTFGESWIAMKVRGFDKGVYNVKVGATPQRGCVVGLYLLDNNVYGDKSADEISKALNENAIGVKKIGEADAFGRTGKSVEAYDSVYANTVTNGDNTYYGIKTTLSELEYGNVEFAGDTNTEYILVFKVEKAGKLDGAEVAPKKSNGSDYSSEKYISIATLSFTPTTATAKNADTFGNTAAFVEHSEDNGDAMLYLVSAIDSLNYSKVGFNLKVDGISVDTDTTTTVYDSLTMSNDDGSTKEFTAADFGLNGGLLYVVSKKLDAGFTGQTIDFTPFAVKGEETITGSTYQATLKK